MCQIVVLEVGVEDFARGALDLHGVFLQTGPGEASGSRRALSGDEQLRRLLVEIEFPGCLACQFAGVSNYKALMFLQTRSCGASAAGVASGPECGHQAVLQKCGSEVSVQVGGPGESLQVQVVFGDKRSGSFVD